MRRGRAVVPSAVAGLEWRPHGLAAALSGLAEPASGLVGPASGLAGRASGLAAPASGLAAPRSGLAAPASGWAEPASGLAAPPLEPMVAPSGLAALRSGLAAPTSGLAGPTSGADGPGWTAHGSSSRLAGRTARRSGTPPRGGKVLSSWAIQPRAIALENSASVRDSSEATVSRGSRAWRGPLVARAAAFEMVASERLGRGAGTGSLPEQAQLHPGAGTRQTKCPRLQPRYAASERRSRPEPLRLLRPAGVGVRLALTRLSELPGG